MQRRWADETPEGLGPSQVLCVTLALSLLPLGFIVHWCKAGMTSSAGVPR